MVAKGGPTRRFPVPIDLGTSHHANLVFVTHEHSDHANALTLGPLLAASPQATLFTSTQGRQSALEVGISAVRIVVPRLVERVTHSDLIYTAVPAAH